VTCLILRLPEAYLIVEKVEAGFIAELDDETQVREIGVELDLVISFSTRPR
jgi:hypothetical protein